MYEQVVEPVAPFGDLGLDYLYEEVNPERDFIAAATTAIGAGWDARGSGYQSFYFRIGQTGSRDALRAQRSAIGWAPAFEWSKEYGHGYMAGGGWASGLVYRDSDIPEAYRPVPQTPAQGGGSLVRLWTDSMIGDQAVAAGTVIRSCTTTARVPSASNPSLMIDVQVVGPSLPVDQPCPAGTGGCPADRACGTGGTFVQVKQQPAKAVYFRPQPPAPEDQNLGPDDQGYKQDVDAVAKPWYKNKWTYIIGGIVIVGGGAAVAVARRRRG